MGKCFLSKCYKKDMEKVSFMEEEYDDLTKISSMAFDIKSIYDFSFIHRNTRYGCKIGKIYKIIIPLILLTLAKRIRDREIDVEEINLTAFQYVKEDKEKTKQEIYGIKRTKVYKDFVTIVKEYDRCGIWQSSHLEKFISYTRRYISDRIYKSLVSGYDIKDWLSDTLIEIIDESVNNYIVTNGEIDINPLQEKDKIWNLNLKITSI